MRSTSRVIVALAFVFLLASPAAFADHFTADCPLSFVGASGATAPFYTSPHGVFENGSVVYVLRGQTLKTLTQTSTGEVQVEREDYLTSLAGRDIDGGTAYSNGYLFVASEAGLEIYDLRNTFSGGAAPTRVSRTTVPHYRRLAVLGNVLVGLYPIDDMPCTPTTNSECHNSIDIYSIANLSAPVQIASIEADDTDYIGFNDIAFVNGYLYALSIAGTYAFDLTNPAAPVEAMSWGFSGSFFITNHTNLLTIGQANQMAVFLVGPDYELFLENIYTLPTIFYGAAETAFDRTGWIDDSRLITMINVINPTTRRPGRTVAFDIFDFSIPVWQGRDDRLYENVSYTFPSEVKHDPIAVGPFVYVLGEQSGAQVWGACGEMSGAIELDRITSLSCGGAEIHGWVTGQLKITQVEVFLDQASLGYATLGEERNDVPSLTPVSTWRIGVDLDDTSEGNHVIRVLATDVDGNRRQISSRVFYFPGPGSNCTSRHRTVKRPF